MGRPAAYAGAYVSQSPSQSLSGVGSLRENTPFHGSETRTEPSARSSHVQNFCVVEGLGGGWRGVGRPVEGCGVGWFGRGVGWSGRFRLEVIGALEKGGWLVFRKVLGVWSVFRLEARWVWVAQ